MGYFDLAAQVGAFVVPSFILFLVTKPNHDELMSKDKNRYDKNSAYQRMLESAFSEKRASSV
jgi:hypothetical protein|eukprot:CAMPEP_0198284716 /NCGR_PEP_ID=MMETSP1449-20131203/4173_1 /TAXON_ID=420275 /ORGANISM="Attheya septentrionalis, Strain CCMP2084" /LENGTH=61 /DNA_ID=CAMNT_0043981925 /DNA_START=275 /DNA_END=460 /DNA_ORIENTATION=-